MLVTIRCAPSAGAHPERSNTNQNPSPNTPELKKLAQVQGGAEADAALLQELRKRGSDLAKPRHTCFYLYFPTKSDAAAAGMFLHKNGDFNVKIGPSTERKEWLILVERTMVISEQSIADFREVFEELAKEFHGTYDGWEAAPDRALPPK